MKVRLIWRGWATTFVRKNYFFDRVSPTAGPYCGGISCGPIGIDFWNPDVRPY